MPAFSKIIEGQRGSQQLVDTDGFIYSRKKPKDTALYSAWGCRKRIPPTKCPCHAYLTLSDNSLSLGSKPHNHPADNAAPQKREVLSSLKRKAAEQPFSVTQNLLSEVLADSASEANQTLPTIEYLARVVQRSRAKASGSAQHSEAKTSEEFLPYIQANYPQLMVVVNYFENLPWVSNCRQ